MLVSSDGKTTGSASQVENRSFRRQGIEKIHLAILGGKQEFTFLLSVRKRTDLGSLLARLAHFERNLISLLGVQCVQIDKDLPTIIPGLRREYGLIVAAKAPVGQSELTIFDVVT